MSLFGGGAFGSNNNANQQQSGSAFGQSASQPAGSLFGSSLGTNSQQPKTSVFGTPANTSTTTGGSLFGQPQQQQQQQPPQQQGQQPAGGSIFGTNLSQPSTGTGSLFGNTQSQPQPQQQQPATGSLFGSTQTQQQQPATGSLFGNTQPQQQQQATGTSNLFGGSSLFNKPAGTNGTGGTTNTGTGSLFGGSTLGQPQQQQQASSLFGNNNAQNQNQPKTGLFGQSASITNPSFSGSTTTQPQRGAGGSSTLGQTTSGNAFAGSSSLLASRASGQPQPDAQVQFAKLSEKIESIVNAWNPSSPQCRFQHCFYNLVEPSQAPLYGRPPNATNDAMWQKAVRENPDPSCMVPVIANGFDDIRERVEAQTQQATAHTQKLQEIQQRLNTLMTTHTTSTVPHLSKFSAAQTQLTIRLLKLIQHLHLLIPSVRSSSIKPEEEELRNRLEEIESILLGHGGRIRGKLGELWAVVGALRARENVKAAGRGGEQWRVVDEEGLQRIVLILQEQQAGLAHLTQVLRKDMKDLNFILNSDSGGGDDSVDVETLFSGSTSTLRASALR